MRKLWADRDMQPPTSFMQYSLENANLRVHGRLLMQRRGVFINPATHNLQLKNQLCPQLAVPFSETEWKTKCALESRHTFRNSFIQRARGLSKHFHKRGSGTGSRRILGPARILPCGKSCVRQGPQLQTPVTNFNTPDAN